MLRTNRCVVDNGAREKQAKACQEKANWKKPFSAIKKEKTELLTGDYLRKDPTKGILSKMSNRQSKGS